MQLFKKQCVQEHYYTIEDIYNLSTEIIDEDIVSEELSNTLFGYIKTL